MGPTEIAVRIVAGLLLILANGFFVAIEFALTRVRQYPEREFDEPGLRRAWRMTDDLEIYLTSCQVGITASSIAVGIVAEPAIAGLVEPWVAGVGPLAAIGTGGIVAFVVINLVHLTHGEQTPTYLGVERTKFVARWGATPLYYFALAISPVIRLGDTVAKWTLGLFGVEMTGAWLEVEEEIIESRADLRNRLGDLLEEGELPEERRSEVLNALDIDERTVGDAMTPRDQVVFLSADDPVGENLGRIVESPHTRFPLVGADPEDFHGIVYVSAVVGRFDALREGDLTLDELAAPPMTLDGDTTLSDAIDQFQAQNQELALVLDDGEVVGLVTATDALEAVMGEIEDPLDRAATGEGPDWTDG